MARTARDLVLVCATALTAAGAGADVRLPAVLGSHMVIQRAAPARIWGWADPGERVSVSASWGEAATASAGDDGRWRVEIPTPPAGGPHTITVSGRNTLTLENVLCGDVWVASGQSNMEWPVAASKDAQAEIAAADHPTIRLFTVPNELSVRPRESCGGAWRECTPASVGGFSGVGYFFAREVTRRTGVPIGVISADWGGTPGQAWTSPEGLASFERFRGDLAVLAAMVPDPNEREARMRGLVGAWWDTLDDAGGVPPEWASGDFDDAAWERSAAPAVFAGDLASFDGVVYLRRVVELPADWDGAAAVLELGPIDDRDDAYVNGARVGGTREDGRWSQARRYPVPTGLLKAGRNVVAVRVLDTGGLGGMNGKPEQMVLRRGDGATAPLAGGWTLRRGAAKDDLPHVPPAMDIHAGTPGVLFNGMIAPITPLGIKGVIWYQGESNRSHAAEYADLFPALIGDWRRAWGQGDFPFYFVQIAPFRYGNDRGETAELREAQARALRVPGTGMVVTMDVGDPGDIHPRNKQEVGRRLALWALAGAYAKAEVEPSGPLFRSAEFRAGEAVVSFEHVQGGLMARGGEPTHLLVAGEDRVFYPARGVIRGGAMAASHPAVPEPVAVRYGWEAACEPNLFNADGLPAAPFRSDSWERGSERIADDTPAMRDPDPGFATLFNGRDLEGWVNVNGAPSTWVASADESGEPVIACSGVPTGVLRTERQYENFVLELEWRHHQAGGNAGLFVWSDALTAPGQPFTRSVEVQVMDGAESDWYTSDGDIFPIHGAAMTPENGRGGDRAFPTERRMRPSPRWNHYRVTCLDGTISLAVNGKVVTRGRAIRPRKGYVCLESEGSPIEFRAIRIKELPGSAPPPPPDEVAAIDEGFAPLYNGVDFAGWTFTPEHDGHWTAKDWTIGFDGGGTHLWTEKSYRDFVLIADWRWSGQAREADLPEILPSGEYAQTPEGKPATRRVPEAGDSGIYLRGNDKSQVNIWCWPIGSGEVYGYRTDAAMPAEVRAGVTPRENADAPIGGWNRFVITMKRDRLTVILNGRTVIEDAALPGVPESGPIALQQHGGAIEFANLYIKELD